MCHSDLNGTLSFLAQSGSILNPTLLSELPSLTTNSFSYSLTSKEGDISSINVSLSLFGPRDHVLSVSVHVCSVYIIHYFAHTHIHTYTHVHTYTHTYTHAYIYINTRTLTYTHLCWVPNDESLACTFFRFYTLAAIPSP